MIAPFQLGAVAAAIRRRSGGGVTPGDGHRYWSLLINTLNPGITQARIAELRLRTVSGGTNVALGKTYSGTPSNIDASYNPSAAFDDSVSTVYAPGVGNSVGARAIVDLGTPAKIVEWVYHPGAAGGFAADGFSLCYSDDGSTWTVADTRTGQSFSDDTPNVYTVPTPSMSHRYWRIAASSNNGDSNLAMQEVEIYEVDNAANIALSKSTLARTYFYANPPEKAVDGDYTNYIYNTYVSDGFDGTLGEWWAVDLGAAHNVSRFVIFPQNYSVGPSRAPKDFKIQWSDDALTGPWTDAKTYTGQTAWTAGTGNTYTLS